MSTARHFLTVGNGSFRKNIISMNKFLPSFYWIARLVAAIILLQTLYFKFSGSEESVYIFAKLGMEPWGRIGTGIFEMIAALMLLVNRTAWIGAAVAFGLMAGAIGMHLTTLGIIVKDDGGYLFFLAVVVALCSVYVLLKDKLKILSLLRTGRFVDTN
jgi:putative oxidoreductase